MNEGAGLMLNASIGTDSAVPDDADSAAPAGAGVGADCVDWLGVRLTGMSPLPLGPARGDRAERGPMRCGY